MRPSILRYAASALVLAGLISFAFLVDSHPRAEAGESGLAYVTLGDTQTLTNKTLTSPSITTPTITTPAITGIATMSVPPVVTTGNLTAGTATLTSTGEVRHAVSRFEWTNAMVVALGGALTGDVTVCTLPAKTEVIDAFVVIDSPGAVVATLTVAVGRTGAGYIDYIVASDAKAAANTVYGDASGERGTNLVGYDTPSYTATTLVKAHFVSTVSNLSACTGSTGHIILVTRQLP